MSSSTMTSQNKPYRALFVQHTERVGQVVTCRVLCTWWMLGLAIKKLWLALAANTCPGYMNGLRKHYWHIEGVPNRCLIARMLTSPCSLMGGHWEVTSLIKETILASLPGMGEEEEKKRLVHTFIATEFCGDCVHQCMYVHCWCH